jgi:hypothetical protein
MLYLQCSISLRWVIINVYVRILFSIVIHMYQTHTYTYKCCTLYHCCSIVNIISIKYSTVFVWVYDMFNTWMALPYYIVIKYYMNRSWCWVINIHDQSMYWCMVVDLLLITMCCAKSHMCYRTREVYDYQDTTRYCNWVFKQMFKHIYIYRWIVVDTSMLNNFVKNNVCCWVMFVVHCTVLTQCWLKCIVKCYMLSNTVSNVCGI